MSMPDTVRRSSPSAVVEGTRWATAGPPATAAASSTSSRLRTCMADLGRVAAARHAGRVGMLPPGAPPPAIGPSGMAGGLRHNAGMERIDFELDREYVALNDLLHLTGVAGTG